MSGHLDNNQLNILRDVLADKLKDVEIKSTEIVTYSNTNDHYLKLFIANKKIEGLSNKTLKQYTNSIRRFYTEMNVDVLKCNSNHVRIYLTKLISYGNSKVSINNARNYLSAFYKWLYEEGYIDSNIVVKIKRTKLDKRELQLLTAYDIEKIKRACQNDREIALIDLLESTGMRCSEVVQFKISDCNFMDKTIVIHGKGSKDRIGCMTPKFQVSLERYLKSRGYENDYVFGRTNGTHDMISDTSIEKSVQRIAERAGISHVVVHKFRHYFCSELCRKGMNIQEVQRLMGHASIETTAKVYNHINYNDVISNFKKYSA